VSRSRSWATARQILEPGKAIRAYLRLLRLMAWKKGLDFPAVKILSIAGWNGWRALFH
jgi:hypothetical protein